MAHNRETQRCDAVKIFEIVVGWVIRKNAHIFKLVPWSISKFGAEAEEVSTD
jgi:hypothetical protein